MATYTFKPALLRGAQTWRLEGDVLTRPDGRETNLTDVTGGQFVDMPAQRQMVAYLDLDTPAGRVRVSCNDHPRGAERAQFFAFVLDVLADLAAANPELQLKSGGGRVMRAFLALIGVGMLGFGAWFAAQAYLDPGSSGDVFAYGMGGAFALIGLGVIWMDAPWKPTPTITPGEMRANLMRQLGLTAS